MILRPLVQGGLEPTTSAVAQRVKVEGVIRRLARTNSASLPSGPATLHGVVFDIFWLGGLPCADPPCPSPEQRRAWHEGVERGPELGAVAVLLLQDIVLGAGDDEM